MATDWISLCAIAGDRERAPSVRDIVFRSATHVPDAEVIAFVRALYATLAPGRPLGAPIDAADDTRGACRVELAASGDGGLVIADGWYGLIRSEASRTTLCHLVTGDELAVRAGGVWSLGKVEVVFELAGAAGPIDVATDAILERGAAAGWQLERRVDVPTSPSPWIAPPRPATARVLRDLTAADTATAFARVLVALFPPWFDFDPSVFAVTLRGYNDVELVVTDAARAQRAVIQTSASRNIHCELHPKRGAVERGLLSMHYVPSPVHRERSRETLAYAMKQLFPEHPLPAGLVGVPAPGRVFPPGRWE